ARNGIGGACKRLQTLGGSLKILVASRMAESIIDAFESVEVDNKHRKAAIATASPCDLAPQAIHEQGAVGEAGQRIVLGDVEEIFFGAFALTNIQRTRQHANDFISMIAQRRFRRQKDAPNAGRVDDLFLDARQRRLGSQDLAIKRAESLSMVLAQKNSDVLAREIGLGHAG